MMDNKVSADAVRYVLMLLSSYGSSRANMAPAMRGYNRLTDSTRVGWLPQRCAWQRIGYRRERFVNAALATRPAIRYGPAPFSTGNPISKRSRTGAAEHGSLVGYR